MRVRVRPAILAFATIMLCVGCDPIKLKEAADRLGASIDESTRKLLESIAIAARESSEWRAEVDRLGNKFQATAKEFPPDAGTQSRMFVDFVLRRLKDNPKAVNNITKLLDEKKYGLALTAFQALQDANPLGQPAEIGQSNPTSLSFNRVSATDYRIDGEVKAIRLNGWNIPFRDKTLKAEVRDAADKPLRDVTQHLKATTHYDAVIDVAQGSGIKFTPDDRTILVSHRGKLICQIALTWGSVPPPERKTIPVQFKSQDLIPPKGRHPGWGGDSDDNFWGRIRFKVVGRCRLYEGKLQTQVSMFATEITHDSGWDQRDHTTVDGSTPWRDAYLPEDGWRIVSPTTMKTTEHSDTMRENDPQPRKCEMQAGELVCVFHVKGVRAHGKVPGPDTSVVVDFNKVDVVLERIQPAAK